MDDQKKTDPDWRQDPAKPGHPLLNQMLVKMTV